LIIIINNQIIIKERKQVTRNKALKLDGKELLMGVVDKNNVLNPVNRRKIYKN
jgi:hypothetical protein